MTPIPDDTTWNEQVAWLRRLARRLVRDECAADDLTQEVVLRALDRGQSDAPRSWWVRVLRNTASNRARSERRRTDREALAARADDGPPTHDVVATAELHQRVTDALLALDEPVREIMLLRYLEGRPPRAIARQLDLPVERVNAHLERGRARLRQRLAREYGGRRSMSIALLPMARMDRSALAASSVAASAVPLATMSVMKSKWIAASVALAALGAWTAVSLVPLDRSTSSGGQAESNVVRDLEPSPLTEVSIESARLAPTIPAAARPPSAEAHEGVAYDIEGQPFAGVELALEADGEWRTAVVADESGRFALLPDDDVVAMDDSMDVIGEREIGVLREFVIAPTVRVAGTVVDATGRPVPNGVVVSNTRIADTPFVDSSDTSWTGEGAVHHGLGSEGNFDLGPVPYWPGRTLIVAGPFGMESFVVPSGNAGDLRLQLAGTLDPPLPSVVVKVLGGDGRPALDAEVSVGARCRSVDASGCATFDVSERTSAWPVVAVRPGFAPAEASLPAFEELRASRDIVSIEIVLSEPTSSVSGVVLDASGAPVEGAKIKIWNGMPFGDDRVAEMRFHDEPRTDEDGLFLVEGLGPRDYTLRAMTRDPLRVAEIHGVQAGASGIALRLPPADATIEGLVVDFMGRPLPDVEVGLVADARSPRSGERTRLWHRVRSVRTTRTDADGSFRLSEATTPHVEVYAATRGVTAFAPVGIGEAKVTIDLRCDVDVGFTTTTAGRSLAVLDGEGRDLTFFWDFRTFASSKESPLALQLQLEAIQLSLTQSTRTIALLEGHRIVRRVDVAPLPDERVRIEL